MSSIPTELQYNDNHLWIRDEGDGSYSIGITEYAQSQLGEIISLELPEEGDTLSAGDECAVIESLKTTNELFSPISGEVIEINEELIESPKLINHDPYYDGWIYKIKADDESELEDLLSNDEYEECIAEEDNEDEL